MVQVSTVSATAVVVVAALALIFHGTLDEGHGHACRC